ncbi:MAG TPA: hypothetical protein VEF33_13450 [Syntrophales bacterium]|nr:hypothetical protein [Syntrophales bacterium]
MSDEKSKGQNVPFREGYQPSDYGYQPSKSHIEKGYKPTGGNLDPNNPPQGGSGMPKGSGESKKSA